MLENKETPLGQSPGETTFIESQTMLRLPLELDFDEQRMYGDEPPFDLVVGTTITRDKGTALRYPDLPEYLFI